MNSGLHPPLRRSEHLSYFERHGQLFAYHDRFGFLLQMSADVVEFLEFHREGPRSTAELQLRFGNQFDNETVANFLATFRRHGCLLSAEDDEDAQLWEMVPVRARWVVFHQPDPSTLTFWRGEESERVEPWAAKLWAAMDGQRSLDAIYEQLREEPGLVDSPDAPARVRELVASWVHHERQYLRLSHLPLALYGPEHEWPSYLRSSMPFEAWDPSQSEAPADPLDPLATPIKPPHDYYGGEIGDAAAQFDDVETTLSHLFRRPHVALGGRSFPQRIVEALAERKLLGPHTRKIMEVGAGLGDFAAGVLGALREEHPQIFSSVRYTILDLSPRLQEAQRARLDSVGLLDKVEFRCGNVETLSPPEAEFDLILSNEVIGDFSTVKLSRELLGLSAEETPEQCYASWSEQTLQRLGESGALIRRLTLPLQDAPEEFFFNLGAVRFMDWLRSALRPGGSAYISEYGEATRYPQPSTHLDHLEFSIHFGHLMNAARSLGLEVEYAYLQDLLKLDRDLRFLETTRSYFRSLRGMLAASEIHLEKLAYTDAQLKELLGDVLPLSEIGDLRFRIADERCMGLAPHEFKALLLTKPAG